MVVVREIDRVKVAGKEIPVTIYQLAYMLKRQSVYDEKSNDLLPVTISETSSPLSIGDIERRISSNREFRSVAPMTPRSSAAGHASNSHRLSHTKRHSDIIHSIGGESSVTQRRRSLIEQHRKGSLQSADGSPTWMDCFYAASPDLAKDTISFLRMKTFYGQALVLYRQREFAQAEKLFQTASEASGLEMGDTASNVMIKRCREFRMNPPPEVWDGVWNFEKKEML